jgi:hypothetical protein
MHVFIQFNSLFLGANSAAAGDIYRDSTIKQEKSEGNNAET